MTDDAPTVKLSLAEVAVSAQVGIMRVLGSLKSGLKHRLPWDGPLNVWENNIVGAIGECGYAKWLQIYWDCSIRNHSTHDVGDVQIKATTHSDGRLVIKDYYSDTQEYVLVVVSRDYRMVHIPGWVHGSDGKLDRYRSQKLGKDRRDVYFVPQSDLRPIKELPQLKRSVHP